MAVLRIVRHGQSTWNAARRVQGQAVLAGALTMKGRREMTALGEDLASLAQGADAIVASDLARSAESATIIGDRLQLHVEYDGDLREQRLGQLEGMRLDDRVGSLTVAEVVATLWRHPFRHPRAGESVAQMYRRVGTSLGRILETRPGSEIIVLTHGGPIRVINAAVGGGGVAAVRHELVANASVTTVTLRDGPAWLRALAA
jgi:probable phosphoglycerate mutase